MNETDTIPQPRPVTEYVEEGARIAAILLVWSIIAAVFTYGLSELGHTGGLFETYSPQVGAVLALAGLLNAILYVFLRVVDYWTHSA